MTQKAAAKTTNSTIGKKSFSLKTLGADFLDTTWRIAVPVVLCAAGGIAADRSWGTAPWLTLLGMVAGFGVAGWLLKRQLSSVGGKQ